MISLIVATLHRSTELERLLNSLDGQVLKDFEVIIVDQNEDERLAPILERHSGLRIRRVRSKPGLSKARNAGLPYANGDILCFPDDDCWYPGDLLVRVREIFDAHPEFSALFVTLRDKNGQTVGPKWPAAARLWTKEDVWVNGISPAGFLRKEAADVIGPFDERLGVGAPTPYQSGEDTDYFVRILETGSTIWYEHSLTVHHPSFHRIERMRETSYSYSLGGGYTLRAHRYPFRRFLISLVRSFGGTVVSLCRGRFVVANCYLLRALGLTRGYFLGSRDLALADRAMSSGHP